MRTAVENGKFLAVCYSTVLGRGPYIKSFYGHCTSVLCVLESSIYKITRRKLAPPSLIHSTFIPRSPTAAKGLLFSPCGKRGVSREAKSGEKRAGGKEEEEEDWESWYSILLPRLLPHSSANTKGPWDKRGEEEAPIRVPPFKSGIDSFSGRKGGKGKGSFYSSKIQCF